MIIKFTDEQIQSRKDIVKGIYKATVEPKFAAEEGDRYLELATTAIRKMQKKHKNV